MSDIELSIIVPVYKTEEKLLRSCIDSLIDDADERMEIILVDDGTPDNGGQIIDEYAQQHKNIISLHQKNQGVSVARNNGIKNARGKYIIFADADDISNLRAYKYAVSEMEKKHLDVCIFKYRRDPVFTEIDGTVAPRKFNLEKAKHKLIYSIAVQEEPYDGYNLGSPWGKAFRKDFIIKNEVEFFPQLRKMQDRIFMMYCVEADPEIALLPIEGYCYIKNERSIVNRYNPKMGEYLLNVAKAIDEFDHRFHTFTKQERNTAISKLLMEYLGIVTLHKDNPSSEKEKARDLKEYCSNAVYETAIKNPDFKLFTRNDVVKLVLLKMHLYSLIIFISKAMH